MGDGYGVLAEAKAKEAEAGEKGAGKGGMPSLSLEEQYGVDTYNMDVSNWQTPVPVTKSQYKLRRDGLGIEKIWRPGKLGLGELDSFLHALEVEVSKLGFKPRG